MDPSGTLGFYCSSKADFDRLIEQTEQVCSVSVSASFEPQIEKTGLWGYQPGLTQTELYSHRKGLEAWIFGFKKKRNCTIREAKTKALIK